MQKLIFFSKKVIGIEFLFARSHVPVFFLVKEEFDAMNMEVSLIAIKLEQAESKQDPIPIKSKNAVKEETSEHITTQEVLARVKEEQIFIKEEPVYENEQIMIKEEQMVDAQGLIKVEPTYLENIKEPESLLVEIECKKPFSCNLCAKAFSSEHLLETHMKKT